MKLEQETLEAGHALVALLEAVGRAIPELDTALRQGARVAFDTHCRVLLVSAIEADGTSGAQIALRCDPGDPESFGEIALPMPVAGMYAPTVWH